MYGNYAAPDYITEQLSLLPELPGVYQFIDASGRIIYVGKAKSLKKRVSSYFHKKPGNAKISIMIRKITSIKHIIVETESDALLLENNLIKKHQPKYNVLLKDDKTFPWICIKNESFPRIFTTRNVIQDGSKYFGPYTSGRVWKSMLDLIRTMYKIRTCSLNLKPEKIAEKNYKVCLEHHLGNCLGPCVGEQSEQNYNQQIIQIERILKGHTGEVMKMLVGQMKEFAAEYNFEEANRLKEKIDMLKQFQAKSTIVSSSITELDVFTIVSDEKFAYVNFMKVVNGAIIQAHSVEIKKQLDEEEEELLKVAIFDLRRRVQSTIKEIVTNIEITDHSEDILPHIPQRGDKRTLVDLSVRNAKYYRMERQKQKIKHLPNTAVSRKLETLKKDLRMEQLPTHIECFDNSNLQGTNAVAACVVFKNARPAKRDYRHFNIKTVEGADDFASMVEVVFRRYKRLLDEGQDLPQLIIVDGGKGQLNAAMVSLVKLDLRGKITLIGIAKRLEEIYFPNDPVPLYLDKNSESLKLIQQLRNEAHRFGITHHRDKRSKELIQSELTEIQGIGDVTRDLIFQEFGSIERMKRASQEDLEKLIGKAKAKLVRKHFEGQA